MTRSAPSASKHSTMISVNDAQNLVEVHTSRLSAETLPLSDTLGMILAEAVVSPLDIPPFDQSAMDGYAFLFGAGISAETYQVIGEIPAGAPTALLPSPGEALRIFTGAPVPEGTDTVVMQEKVERNGSEILIGDPLLKKGGNVRLRGSQTKKGSIALDAGTKLNPAAIGFLAGLGIGTVKVWAKPSVCLIITGKELAPPELPLGPGQVYESNSFTLTAALQSLKIQPKLVFRSDDEETQITTYLKQGMAQCDLVIVTGGISVGDYDLVKKSMDHCGVETVFYKVKQKPGKPLFFGKKDKTLLFGLPGNPAAVLTCFYEYIAPAIRKMTGNLSPEPGSMQRTLTEGFHKKAGLTYLLKGKLQGDLVTPLDAQESYMMNSFAAADCLILLEEEKTSYQKGDRVVVHPFPSV